MYYEQLLPQQVLFSLKDLQDIGVLKVSTAKKLINEDKLTATKIGVKLFIPRPEIIRYLDVNTKVASC